MRTVIVGERPSQIDELIRRRQELGQDRFDEVWEGEYHMVPAPNRWHAKTEFQLALILGPLAKRVGLEGTGGVNIGSSDNYRVPDQAYFADRSGQVFNPTAEIVVEIVSPGDESRMKFDFYFAAGVKEVLIIDPDERSVEWYARDVSAFRLSDASALLGISAAELGKLIDWPD